MRVLLFANTEWFLYNFKLALARALRAQGHEVILVSPPGPYGERLHAEGFQWEPFPLSRSGANPLAEWRRVRALRQLYRRLQPELVHHFTIKCIIYGSLAARAAGVKRIVNSVTGLGFALLGRSLKARLLRPVVLALYRHTLCDTDVIFQNADNRAALEAAGVLKRSRVALIGGDGIDTGRFRPATASPSGHIVVLMMARLLWSKGVAEYVEAAALVRQVRPDVRFLLAGGGDAGNPENIPGEQLEIWRAQGHVEFLGQREDALALQQGCTLAVLASREGEGMPRALLEAAACGRPVVATDVPGNRDLVTAGVTGLLVPPRNAGALATAILELLSDAARATRFGQAGRERVVAEFSDEEVNRRTFAVYGLEWQR